MEKKTAAYICTGCGIGEALDIEALSKVATDEYKAPICRTNNIYCSPEGVAEIQKDIESEGVNTVVIAACSPRVNYDAFDLGHVILDRANIREQVVWCHPPNDEDTQMLAEDYLRMAMVKVDKMELPEPYLGEEGDAFSKDILVVGGGVAGMHAALGAANAGYQVSLVEKEEALGGFGAKLKKSTPTKPPYQELEDTIIPDLISQVEANEKIKIFTSAEIEKIEGAPGLFDATITSNGSQDSARYGAIIQATGWTPYDAEKLPHLGYGSSPDVITNVQLEEMAAAGTITRPSNGSEPKAVAFIQCAGSRDEEHLPYCSAVCCRASLKQSLYLKEQNPEMAIYVIYKDIRTPGQDEELYRQAQRAGVLFIRGEVEEVSAEGDQLSILAEDVMLQDKVSLEELDLIVLATGLVPNAAVWLEELTVEEEAKEAGEDEEGAGEPPKVDNSILKLAYRQGPDLPNLKYGFPDSHFICFPYETRRTGIYTAGTVRRPMTMTAAAEDATGAAMKAIQAVEAVSTGKAVHPRAGDLSQPEFFMQRCTQCKRCTEECPFGAINEDNEANPLPNPTRCRRCGICMGSCPERIISFKNYSVDMIGSMIKAIEVPEEFDEKPRVLALVCENDAYPALDMTGFRRLEYNPWVRVIPLRCLGSINLVWIADALAKGIDGIILFSCKPGDDYQCHFIKGSELAETRLSKIAETLDRLVLESDRVRVEQIAITDYERIPEILDDFLETIDAVGPNPYKDF
ncbi:MAG: hydrogenase iron-sulfur subunit [Candidatus Adiutricales bacterium]